jgi:hypothetical protein
LTGSLLSFSSDQAGDQSIAAIFVFAITIGLCLLLYITE